MHTCPQTGLVYHSVKSALAFRQALKAEDVGDAVKAERFLTLAVKYDVPDSYDHHHSEP